MKRHLAIGDIHGCSEAFRALCDVVNIQSDDTVITLGDYVNRGPNTNAVLDLLIRLKTRCNLRPLRGNHEIMMLDARDDAAQYDKWIGVGGDATLKSYAPFEGDPGRLADIPNEHWQFLDNDLLPWFETDTHLFVHANAYPNMPMDEQPDYMLYWERFDEWTWHKSGKMLVCGHTSQKSGLPRTNGRAICIDTWACGVGWLTCLHAESGQMWQANQRGETRRLSLDDLD